MTTIRARLLAPLLGGLVLVLVAGGVAVWWVARAGLLHQFDAALAARARSLATSVSYESGALLFETAEARALHGDTWFEIRTADGTVLKRSDDDVPATLPDRVPGDDGDLVADVTMPDGAAGRATWHAFHPKVEDADEGHGLLDPGEERGDAPAGDGPERLILVVAMDRGAVDGALATLLGALGAVGAVILTTVVVLVTLGVRWGLAPLDQLRRRVGGVEAATISTRFDERGAPGELVPIHRELNRMLDRVEAVLRREQSFAAAAAHELRTPLAELRSSAEVALRWPDADAARSALETALEIAGEMERLVESLLHISRGETPADAADRVPVGDVVAACLARTNGALDAKSLRLDVETDAGAGLRAPRDALDVIVRNLVDNAVRYTPRLGRIVIRDRAPDDGAPALVIENGPVALTPDDVPRLFEPFWRDESARSDRTHVGLGLTVVRRVAAAVGLDVGAALVDGRLRVVVRPTDVTADAARPGPRPR